MHVSVTHIYTYNVILLSPKQEGNPDIWNNMEECEVIKPSEMSETKKENTI